MTDHHRTAALKAWRDRHDRRSLDAMLAQIAAGIALDLGDGGTVVDIVACLAGHGWCAHGPLARPHAERCIEVTTGPHGVCLLTWQVATGGTGPDDRVVAARVLGHRAVGR